MRQVLLSLVFVLSSVAQINAQPKGNLSGMMVDEWSGPNAVSNVIRQMHPAAGCAVAQTVIELTRNIVFGMPSDVSYHLFNKPFYSRKDEIRDIYAAVYQQFLMLTKGLKPGVMKKQMVIMNAPEANLLAKLTDTEVAQYLVVNLACDLAGTPLKSMTANE